MLGAAAMVQGNQDGGSPSGRAAVWASFEADEAQAASAAEKEGHVGRNGQRAARGPGDQAGGGPKPGR